MKKILFVVAALITFVSCGNKTVGSESICDSVAVDSIEVVYTLVVDTL